LLLLDEPFAHLDELTAEVAWSSISRWREETGGTIAIVTHDSLWAERHATQQLHLREGRLWALQRPMNVAAKCEVE
jgi:ABC-type sulfate/molybdate transport systems ATPase subunit